MSTFSGLNIGLSSLYASRRALELTGQNISNVNTEGYSRQRVDLQSVGGPIKPALHSKYDGAGNGVMVAGVDRLRDMFLEARALTERGTAAGLAGDRVLLGRVEAVLAEPGEAGIQKQLADFWDGWDDVANKPDSLAARSQLIERAQTLAERAQRRRRQARRPVRRHPPAARRDRRSTSTPSPSAWPTSTGPSQSATRAGMSPNDLLDKRDVLVQRLGELTGVTVRHGEAGSVDVLLGDTALVTGTTTAALKVQGDGGTPPGSEPVAVAWADPADPDAAGAEAVAGGAVGSMLKGLNEVLPRYRGAAHRGRRHRPQRRSTACTTPTAFDQDGAPGEQLLRHDRRPARRQRHRPRQGRGQRQRRRRGAGDRGGAKAAQLAELSTAKGGADELYRRTVVALGVEAQAAGRRVEIQDDILGAGRRGPGVRVGRQPRRGDDQHAGLPEGLRGRGALHERHRPDARHPDQPHRRRRPIGDLTCPAPSASRSEA